MLGVGLRLDVPVGLLVSIGTLIEETAMPAHTHFVDGPRITARCTRHAVRRLVFVLAVLFLALPGGGEAAQPESDRSDISGRWLHDGTPKAGGTVHYKGEGLATRGTVTTDAEGRFTIDDLKPGWYVLQVDLLGNEGLDLERGLRSLRGGFVRHRFLHGRQPTQADLNTWSTTLSGTLRDADGKPWSNALLWLERPGPMPNHWIAGELHWVDLTDINGDFEFRGMPSGRWRLLVQKTGLAPTVAWVELSDEQPSVRRDLVLEAASLFTFRAVGPKGEAPTDLYATLTDDEDRTLVGKILQADDEGWYTLEAPAGSGRLWLRGPHTDTRAFDINAPGRQEQPWVLPARGQIRLTGHDTPRALAVRLTREDGTVYRSPEGGLVDTQRPYLSKIRSPLGQWTVHVEGPDGYRWSGEVVVTADVEAVVELPSTER